MPHKNDTLVTVTGSKVPHSEDATLVDSKNKRSYDIKVYLLVVS
jgi:hypothetical protein